MLAAKQPLNCDQFGSYNLIRRALNRNVQPYWRLHGRHGHENSVPSTIAIREKKP